MTLSPVADTYVDNSLTKNNFGTSSSIKLDTTVIQYGFLKFDLTPLAGKTIINAKLKLYFTNATTSIVSVKTIADTTWTETGLTYSKLPSLNAIHSISSSGALLNSTKEIDITSLLTSQTGKLTSLVLSVSSSDGADFRSKNSSTNQPVLELQYR